MLDLLAPGEVGDVHESVDAFFEFHEDAEVGEVLHRSGQLRAGRVFRDDVHSTDQACCWRGRVTSYALHGRVNTTLDLFADFQEVVGCGGAATGTFRYVEVLRHPERSR